MDQRSLNVSLNSRAPARLDIQEMFASALRVLNTLAFAPTLACHVLMR